MRLSCESVVRLDFLTGCDHNRRSLRGAFRAQQTKEDEVRDDMNKVFHMTQRMRHSAGAYRAQREDAINLPRGRARCPLML